jgi:23S rRNA pseudouridine2604 synthase
MSLNENNKIEYPVRINRYLFLKGYCSRRKADDLIKRGAVKINGKPALIGQKVQSDDDVQLSKDAKAMPARYKYFLYNKPRGVVSHNPQFGEKSADTILTKSTKGQKSAGKIAPVGRLDKDSEGLMLLTNDGRIIDKILNPKHSHEKEYYVTVDKKVKQTSLNAMSKGVQIEGYRTKPTKTQIAGDKTFKIILTEGKKHQIRRMCAALGYQVKKLKRVRIMNLRLGNLKTGDFRELTNKEKERLFKEIDSL